MLPCALVTPRPRNALSTAALALALALLCACSAPRYRGPVSDHFDGRNFFDGKTQRVGFGDLLRWQTHRQHTPWPARVQHSPQPPPPPRVAAGQLRVTFINHATVLVQLDGANVLTDPIYSERASPLAGVGPRRVRPPGVAFADLPPIDVVVLSHNHYDHLDLATLRRLWQRDRPVILAGLGNRALLLQNGIGQGAPDRVRDLDWWQDTAAAGLRLTSVPNQHGSLRGLCDRDATLWTAYVIAGPQAGAVYFAGDTGYGAHFREVGARFPGLRLALLPIGAYRPRWFMRSQHISPDEAVLALGDLKARTAVAMHFGTFDLADEGIDEPVRDLRAALERTPALRDRFWVLGFGEGRDLP